MSSRILLLGDTGKMGSALKETLQPDHTVIGVSSRDFDACDFDQVRAVVDRVEPEIVVNTVAFLGIDPCEREPERAYRLNALYPRCLAELAAQKDLLLIHFSTDAVFDDEKQDYYVESDAPMPMNTYGKTKHDGDCFIQSMARRHYIARIPVLFGRTTKNNQFVEKMIAKIRGGADILSISDDIVSSPTYNRDVAGQVKKMIEGNIPYGLYHLCNSGKASLYELMREIVENLDMKVVLRKASYKDFDHIGRKNTFTPLRSEKLEPLRSWREAVKSYCEAMNS